MDIMRRNMEDIKKDPNELVEIKNTVSELKHTWDGINSRLDTAKGKRKWIWIYSKGTKWNTEKGLKKDDQSISELWDNIKQFKHVNGVPEGKVEYKWCQKKLRNNGGRFFKFENLQQQIQEIQHTPSKRNTTLKYIIIKLLKTSDEEKNNKSNQRKRDTLCTKEQRSARNHVGQKKIYLVTSLKYWREKKIGKLDSIPSK